ncbi:MAG: RNA polymerase factor sigma-32 [Alphaproteobacteria bacterium]|jgi:RNA polymerase sigma-32 factor|nr:RNA polymerase factor sigma-32 [Alphaproteobacteria bacterium]
MATSYAGYLSDQAERRFIKETVKTPMLSREREFALAVRWRDHADEEALHEMVLAYSRLVVATATRYRNYGLPVSDLIQEGNIGLMQAAVRFEPERGLRFSTYSSWWVRSAMQDYILRNWSIVRTGTTAAQKSLFFNFRRLRAKIDKSGAALMAHELKRQVARELRVKLGDVEMMEGRLAGNDHSLNAAVGETGENEWQDFLADTRPQPDDIVLEQRDAAIRSGWLHNALAGLSDRERHIIGERRLQDETITLEALGRELGISKERVRQIEHRAIEKLRDAIRHHAGLGESGRLFASA